MTLKHRLILVSAAAVFLSVLGLFYTAERREAGLSAALNTMILRDQAALWQNATTTAARDLAARVNARLPETHSNAAELIAGLRATLAARPGLIAELWDAEGGLLYRSASHAAPLIDRYSLADLTAAGLMNTGRAPLGQHDGLWVSPGHGAVILVAQPRQTRAGRLMLLIAEPADASLAGMSAQLDGAALVLRDLRGRDILTAGDPGTAPQSDLRAASVITDRAGVWLASPVPGPDGRQLAQLISRYDPPALMPRGVALLLAALAALLSALLISWLLRPLGAALKHLSAGEGAGHARPSLQQAVESAARNRRRIEEISLQSSRRQLRQERLIRAEIGKLASALDERGQAEMLGLLNTPQQSEAGRDELGLLASVLGLLSRRITAQHQQLSGLIAELREALVTRARLAGLEQELSIARDVQLAMVPQSFPDLPGHQLAGQMIPAKEVGGDFFDFFALDDHRYAVMIGDVSGKGVPAALFMAICRTLLRASARYEADPARCVASVNDFLAAENGQMLFVTLFFGIYDARSGALDYVNAGHNPPLLRRRDGSLSLLPVTGDMALAVMEGEDYRSDRLLLGPGDLLLCYTDGVTEATDPDKALYGEARMLALAGAGGEEGPAAVVSGLIRALEDFAAGSEQADDITLLALQRG